MTYLIFGLGVFWGIVALAFLGGLWMAARDR